MSLELILGPMFAGKTSALQAIIRRHEALGLSCVAYKPQIDTRYGADEFLYNHDKVKVAAHPTQTLLQNLETPEYKQARLVIVEEGQFFADIVPFVLQAVETDTKHVVVAGLDGDRYRKPFGDLLQLVPLADRITKLTSFCKMCADGTLALFTYGRPATENTVHVGGADVYMPVCRKHYISLISSDQGDSQPTT
jgi:thymidine kinase